MKHIRFPFNWDKTITVYGKTVVSSFHFNFLIRNLLVFVFQKQFFEMIIQIFKTLSQDVLYVARYGFRLIKSGSGSGSLASYLRLRTGQRIKKRLCGSKRSRPRAERRPCNSFACEAEWVPAAWEDCSANCGKQGKQYRLGGVEHFTVTANSSRGVSSRLLHRCNSTGIEEGKQCSRERISSPNTLTYEKKLAH